MNKKEDFDRIYVPSEEVVARDIEGELLIVPLTSGVGDMEDELYTLNKTGRAIWEKLSPGKTLGSLIQELSEEYSGSVHEIEQDVMGLIEELLKRNIIVESAQ